MRPALALVFCIGMTSAALAHVGLESATPAPGSVLVTAPERAVLRFDSEVEHASARFTLRHPDGDQRPLTPSEGEGLTRELTVPIGDLRPGEYHLLWSVVCRDGHRLAGSLRFTIKYR